MHWLCSKSWAFLLLSVRGFLLMFSSNILRSCLSVCLCLKTAAAKVTCAWYACKYCHISFHLNDTAGKSCQSLIILIFSWSPRGNLSKKTEKMLLMCSKNICWKWQKLHCCRNQAWLLCINALETEMLEKLEKNHRNNELTPALSRVWNGTIFSPSARYFQGCRAAEEFLATASATNDKNR